jgi:ADP-ribose pyrophosphatase YjhB (NUDIX family)
MAQQPTSTLEFLEELRRIAQWGLGYTTDPYDVERYTRLLELASIEYSALSGVPKNVIMERFQREIGGNATPKVGVDAAIFDASGRILLLRRDDDQLWCVPGGWAELGETPQESVAREVLEETTLEVDVKNIINTYARMPGQYGQPHTSCHLIFHCVVRSGTPQTTPEALEIGYFDRATISDWHRDMANVTSTAMAYWEHHIKTP